MNNIESILWVQHEDPSKNGYLIMNGNTISFSDKEKYNLASQKIFRVFSLSTLDFHFVKNYIKESANNYFQLGSSLLRGVAYKSCFNEKDIQGRPIPFMFWKPSFKLNSFTQQAKEAASQLNKTLNENELSVVNQYIKRIQRRRICLFILVVMLLSSILFLV